MNDATLNRLFQQAMKDTQPQSDPRKGKTRSEWADITGKSDKQMERHLRALVKAGSMVKDTDWRANEDGTMRRTPVYRLKARRDE